MYFKIKGFKGLKKMTKLDMAPITILVGKNGSGKSSAISALDNIKNIYSLGSRFKDNKMESFLDFTLPKRTDFGVEIGGELEYAIPINLSFFKDKFELRTRYSANTDLIYLSRFEIFNITKDETLFHLGGEKLIAEDEWGKTIEALTVSIKINLDYLIDEFNRLKNIKPFDMEEFRKLVVNTTPEESQDIEQQEREKFEEFIRNLQVGFDDYKDDFKLKNSALNVITARADNFQYLESTLEDLSLFTLKKDDKLIDAGDYIDKLASLIQNGMEFKYSHTIPGISGLLIALFDEKSIHNLFSNNSLSSIQLNNTDTGYNLPEALGAEITSTPLFKELIDSMLFDNIHSNTSYLLKEAKFTYIPPNRISKYSTKNETSSGFALNTYSKALKNAGYSDKSSSFFINYWFKKFNIIEDEVDLDLAIKMLENSRELEKEGYGIQQIIPLIIILSLSEKLHNSDLTDDKDQWMKSMFDQYLNTKKFLIEEPEANLHPSFQSKLADLFLDAWIKYDHEFVIETHSEYLIRKLQYHVGSGKIDPSVINIYYFDKDEEPRKININKDGSLSEEFGPGFYDEADNIAIEIFKLNKNQLN
ncbi:MAG: AAA family ATPase [Bacteroidetes bacterium]|jgi:AAA15 family ATPase/GTPase|nr:AAA family ATPase [Bacteroidota bacterium]